MLSFHDLLIQTEDGRALLTLDSDRDHLKLQPGVHLLSAPNGFGKSTLFQTLAGIRLARKGQVRWNGKKLTESYYFSEYIRLPRYIYPSEWIDFLSAGNGGEAAREWIRLFALESVMNRTLGKLSQGERRKIEWIASALHPASVVLMDEPLNGLDLLAIDAVGQLLGFMRSKGKLVWMISHQAGEIFPWMDSLQVVQNQRLVDWGKASHDFKGFQDRLLQHYRPQ